MKLPPLAGEGLKVQLLSRPLPRSTSQASDSLASASADPALDAGVASSTLGVLGAVMGAPSNAVAANAEKLQQKYGLPPLPKAPDGFSQILSVFGKANSQGRGPSAEQVQREPIFVSFNYPSGWITKSPLQASARARARACAPRSPLTSVLRALAARI